ncbi:aa_trans domain-containing protein [Caerostris extrusa]|uniref:Aa_trans domain-containing protein n=1 Tax=Caerostris extrusa TaxID=172846 RepID=A0AAV4QQQ9_CAEEX|nr:aa_trans domain-containing protein [Caerostris extrusa]
MQNDASVNNGISSNRSRNDFSTAKVNDTLEKPTVTHAKDFILNTYRKWIGKSGSDEELSLAESGLSSNMTTLFVIASVIGTGILNLPEALKNSGWIGVFLIIICGLNSLYASLFLAWCWNIMQESWPEYRKANMIPYPEIGMRAFGSRMKYTVMVTLVVSQICSSIYYLLVIAKHMDSVSSGNPKLCYMMILAAVLISPLLWLRTPKNMGCLPVINVLSTVFFVLLCLVAFFMDKETIGPVQYNEPTLSSFAFAFGVIMYSYGGASMYPTIQNDMRNRKLFPQSVFTAFLGKV